MQRCPTPFQLDFEINSQEMMRNKLILLAGFLALGFACSPTPDENEIEEIVVFDEKDLPDPIALVGKKYNFPNITNPRNILCLGDYLVVSERSNRDLLHILDIKSEKYIRSTGKNGLGPGEATLVWKLEPASEKDSFWCYDLEQTFFSKYSVNEGTSKLAESQLRLGEIFHYVADLTWASDTSLLVTMVDGNDKYFEVSLQGDTLAAYGTWDSMIDRKDIPYNVISSIHQGRLKASPNKRKFIAAGSRRDFIDVLDKASGKILSIRGPVDEVPEFDVDYSRGYPMAAMNMKTLTVKYLDSYAGKERIYGLHLGKSFRNISDPDKLNRMFVFDYQGKIVNQYSLDYPLTGFTVDEDNGIIYGLTVDAEPNVVAFKIPD